MTLLTLCRQLAALRRLYTALRRGGCRVIHADEESLLFIRQWQDEHLLIAIRRTGRATLSVPYTPLLPHGTWRLLCGEGKLDAGAQGMALDLAAESASLWLLRH